MDVPLSITAALGGGLRSRHVVVRERWSVRSQHSLTTPDPSSGREQHRGCLLGDSRQNGFFRCGQKSNVLTRRKKEVAKGPLRMIAFGGFRGINNNHVGVLERDPVLSDSRSKPA